MTQLIEQAQKSIDYIMWFHVQAQYEQKDDDKTIMCILQNVRDMLKPQDLQYINMNLPDYPKVTITNFQSLESTLIVDNCINGTDLMYAFVQVDYNTSVIIFTSHGVGEFSIFPFSIRLKVCDKMIHDEHFPTSCAIDAEKQYGERIATFLDFAAQRVLVFFSTDGKDMTTKNWS